MGSSMIHTYFAIDVYHELNYTCQNIIKYSTSYYKLQDLIRLCFIIFLVGVIRKDLIGIFYEDELYLNILGG